MKNFILAGSALLMLAPGLAHAQDATKSFSGFKAGLETSRERLSLRNDPGSVGAAGKSSKSGIGYRGYVGYDVELANFVVGAEAGVGGGSKTVGQAGTTGNYFVDPGVTYDVSARAGFVPTNGLLLYGRGGYRWLRTERTTSVGAVSLTTRQTEHAFTYGGGVEAMLSDHLSLRAEYDRTPYDKNLRDSKMAVGAAFHF